MRNFRRFRNQVELEPVVFLAVGYSGENVWHDATWSGPMDGMVDMRTGLPVSPPLPVEDVGVADVRYWRSVRWWQQGVLGRREFEAGRPYDMWPTFFPRPVVVSLYTAFVRKYGTLPDSLHPDWARGVDALDGWGQGMVVTVPFEIVAEPEFIILASTRLAGTTKYIDVSLLLDWLPCRWNVPLDFTVVFEERTGSSWGEVARVDHTVGVISPNVNKVFESRLVPAGKDWRAYILRRTA